MRCPCSASLAVQHSLLRRSRHPDRDPANGYANIGRACGYANSNCCPTHTYSHTDTHATSRACNCKSYGYGCRACGYASSNPNRCNKHYHTASANLNYTNSNGHASYPNSNGRASFYPDRCHTGSANSY